MTNSTELFKILLINTQPYNNIEQHYLVKLTKVKICVLLNIGILGERSSALINTELSVAHEN